MHNTLAIFRTESVCKRVVLRRFGREAQMNITQYHGQMNITQETLIRYVREVQMMKQRGGTKQ